MQKEIGRVLGGAALLLIIGSTAAAADEWKTCANSGMNPYPTDIAIAACTSLITSNEYKGEDLGDIFSNRGLQYLNAGQYDLAIQDFGQAIRLNPEDAWAFYGRGRAKQKMGDTAGANADIARALQLRPDIGK
jgi:tetratricopeptide (TPR) repeat protein